MGVKSYMRSDTLPLKAGTSKAFLHSRWSWKLTRESCVLASEARMPHIYASPRGVDGDY